MEIRRVNTFMQKPVLFRTQGYFTCLTNLLKLNHLIVESKLEIILQHSSKEIQVKCIKYRYLFERNSGKLWYPNHNKQACQILIFFNHMGYINLKQYILLE